MVVNTNVDFLGGEMRRPLPHICRRSTIFCSRQRECAPLAKAFAPEAATRPDFYQDTKQSE